MTIDELRHQPEERVVTRIVIPSYAFKLRQPADDDEDEDDEN